MSCHSIPAAVDLIGFLTLGLLGSVGHCVGMCSPFVLFVSRRYTTPESGRGAALASQAWYTSGRIVTYAILGALAGALGGVVQTAGALVGVRRGALVVAGAVLVAWAVVALSDLAWRTRTRNPAGAGDRPRTWNPASAGFTWVAGLLKRRVPGHPFATGLFLGLLPCGFLYSAVVGAIGLGSAWRGAAALALFGLGTAPALLGLSLADELLARRRGILNRLSQAFILIMGASFLWRGLVQ